MIKFIESTGRNEEEAVSAALQTLGLTRDDVSVEILDRAKSGFLGFGATPARVKVSYEAPDPVPEEAPKQESKPAFNPDTERVDSFLAGLFERMGVAAEIKSEFNAEDNTINVELSGPKVGSLIGRRGETLDAIQHLSNYVINNGSGERTRVNIDAENYRAKRADALGNLAKKTAVKVVKYRRNMTLEPMNAYERHVIHTALQDFEGVTTYSTGTEPNRRVVVAYEKPVRSESTQSSRPTPAKPIMQDPPTVDNTRTREWH